MSLDSRRPQGRKAVRLIGCGGLILLTAIAVTATAGSIPLHYYLPVHQPGGAGERRTVVYPPAVFGTVVTGGCVLAEIGWLIWNLIRAPRPRLWAVAAAVAAVAVAAAVVVAGSDRPSF